MKQCPACGKEYEDSWKVCLTCSNKLVESGTLNPSEKPFIPTNNPINLQIEMNLFYASILVLIFIIPIIGALILFPVAIIKGILDKKRPNYEKAIKGIGTRIFKRLVLIIVGCDFAIQLFILIMMLRP